MKMFRAIARRSEAMRVHGRVWGGRVVGALCAWVLLVQVHCTKEQVCTQEQYLRLGSAEPAAGLLRATRRLQAQWREQDNLPVVRT